MGEIEGNPLLFVEKVLKNAYSKFLEDVNKAIQQAYDTSRGLLANAYEESINRAMTSLREYYNEALNDIRYHEVNIERDIRIELQNLESQLIDRVMSEVYNRLIGLSLSERRAFYENLMKRVLPYLGEEKLILYVSPADIPIVNEILDRYELVGRTSVKEDPSIELGFIVTNSERTMFLDYSLKTIFDSLKPYLMARAKSLLFGEER